MDHKIKPMALSTVVVGVLMTPASGLARDYWHWWKHDNRWDRRADLRSDYQNLEKRNDNDNVTDALMRVTAKSPKMRRGSGIEHDIHADRRARRWQKIHEEDLLLAFVFGPRQGSECRHFFISWGRDCASQSVATVATA